MKYKFKAECQENVDELMNKLSDKQAVVDQIIPDEYLPDVEVLISLGSLTLSELRDAMREVEDGHIMVQTLAPEESYTGKRDYRY